MANPLVGRMLNNVLEREGKKIPHRENAAASTSRLSLNQEKSLKQVFLSHHSTEVNTNTYEMTAKPAVFTDDLRGQKPNTQPGINFCTLEDLAHNK